MDTTRHSRRRSVSAPFVPQGGPPSPRERVLRALELGRRGQLLRKMGDPDADLGAVRAAAAPFDPSVL